MSNIYFNDFEIQALTLALIEKTFTKKFRKLNISDLKTFIPDKVFKACLETVKDIKNDYKLFLNDPNFLVRFIIHVNNLFDRVKFSKQETEDTMLTGLALQYPFIYDLSLYTAEDLSKHLNISISYTETTYLLLHFGSYLISRKQNLINTVIITVNYYNNADSLLTSLSKHFGDDISISEIKTNFSNEDINSKLILTTEDNIDVKDNNYVVKITPFLTDTDVIKIKKMINKIRHDVQTDKIIKFLHEFTSPNLFFNDLNFKNKKQCLVYAADKLLQYQYVGKDFLNEICERERMAPTLFDTVAMPHSLKLNAKKSQMVVMINNKPIKWSVDN
ncbi:transcriptional antiterminator, partial [Oenococcus oeni]